MADLLLGVYSTRGSVLPPDEILGTARRSGDEAALAWSALAADRASDAACERTLAAWTGRNASSPRSA
jgi:hypothetical protein